MDALNFSPAKAVLLAVQLASQADIPKFRTLISRRRNIFSTDLVLRILLSHLPESTESSDYVPFLKDLISVNGIEGDSEHLVDSSALEGLEEGEAKKRVRKLGLLPLKWPNALEDVPEDPLVLFLIHRSLLIDANTGLIDQLPLLLSPFLHHSQYLRTWMISTVLPLLRFNYEYHPDEVAILTIPQFESLNDRAGVNLLLSKTGKNGESPLVGRDLRGLVGPWMYGDTLLKRRKLRKESSYDISDITRIGAPTPHHKYAGWEEVFRWTVSQAEHSWKTAVEVVEQWDGPGDVDLGEYADGTEWLDEEDQLHLEKRYGRSVLASAYTIPEMSEDALQGIQKMLVRIIALLDKERIPTLQAAAAILTPVPVLKRIELSKQTAKHFRDGLQDEDNVVTVPTDDSIRLLHALLVSAFICTRMRCPISIRIAGMLVCLQDEEEQREQFNLFMKEVAKGPKEDDKYWIRMRNELLWLRSWGDEELPEGSDGTCRGILGSIPKEFIETQLLKAFLTNTRYSLARSIYETSLEQPLPQDILANTIIIAAMDSYDSASNPNRGRGGVRKADEILQNFSTTLHGHVEAEKLQELIEVTAEIGKFRLVLKQGEPFRPVSLRTQEDPISIIGKILEQNPGSYTSIGKMIELGQGMIKAGLGPDLAGQFEEKIAEAEKRVIAMCVDAALTEDDFETAYSYVVNRVNKVGKAARARAPEHQHKGSGLFAAVPPKVIDDYSWRAALQAGKYRRNAQTVKPTHLGTSSGNPEIRHLEHRKECLAQALRLAPKATLQEILNVFRRCEEELESLCRTEEEQSEAWDEQGDENTGMPGGFAPTPRKASRAMEEEPMSLLDLSRATLGSAISTITKKGPTAAMAGIGSEPQSPTTPGSGSGTGTPPVRRRDQLRNAAVGGLASGVGWLIGAQPNVNTNQGSSSGSASRPDSGAR